MTERGGSVAEQLAELRERMATVARRHGREPSELRLVAVSKGVDARAIREAALAGQTDFGENYLQPALDKIAEVDLPGLRWHMVGQLQSNKAVRVARHFDLIHSLCSLRAARAISGAMAAAGTEARVLLQVKLGGGPGRGGIEAEKAVEFAETVTSLGGLSLDGVMGVAPQGKPARPFFEGLRELLEELRHYGLPNAPLTELSAGMTADWEDAVAAGATIVRLGRAVFGERSKEQG